MILILPQLLLTGCGNNETFSIDNPSIIFKGKIMHLPMVDEDFNQDNPIANPVEQIDSNQTVVLSLENDLTVMVPILNNSSETLPFNKRSVIQINITNANGSVRFKDKVVVGETTIYQMQEIYVKDGVINHEQHTLTYQRSDNLKSIIFYFDPSNLLTGVSLYGIFIF